MSQPSAPPSTLRAFAVYNAARLGLLALFAGILWLGGFRGMVLLMLALVFSGVASYFALARQRVAASQALAAQVQARRDRLAARVAAEDAAADEILARQQASGR